MQLMLDKILKIELGLQAAQPESITTIMVLEQCRKIIVARIPSIVCTICTHRQHFSTSTNYFYFMEYTVPLAVVIVSTNHREGI